MKRAVPRAASPAVSSQELSLFLGAGAVRSFARRSLFRCHPGPRAEESAGRRLPCRHASWWGMGSTAPPRNAGLVSAASAGVLRPESSGCWTTRRSISPAGPVRAFRCSLSDMGCPVAHRRCGVYSMPLQGIREPVYPAAAGLILPSPAGAATPLASAAIPTCHGS